MKFLNFVAFCIFGLLPNISFSAGPPICTLDGNGRVTNTDLGGANDFCRLSASEFRIEPKYAGLCTSAPTEANYRSVCTAIFDDPAGQNLTITPNASFPLVGEVSLPEGTYTHAWILVGNTVSYKASAQFTPDRIGKNGTTGPFCWTLSGNTSPGPGAISDSSNIATWLAECGAAIPSDIGTSFSTIVALFDFAQLKYSNSSSGINGSGSFDVILLDASGNPSDVQADGSYTRVATQMGGIQTFTTPVIITPNTVNIDIGFRLENTFGVLLGKVGVNTNHVPRFGVGGFEFKVLAQ
jgi:hypothetical protein